jgi:hypothetical protein
LCHDDLSMILLSRYQNCHHGEFVLVVLMTSP